MFLELFLVDPRLSTMDPVHSTAVRALYCYDIVSFRFVPCADLDLRGY